MGTIHSGNKYYMIFSIKISSKLHKKSVNKKIPSK